MKNLLKNTMKFAVGTCVALGSVAAAATVLADSKVAKVVSAGVSAAKDAIKGELEALKSGNDSVVAAESSSIPAEEAAMFADVEEKTQETTDI